MAKLSSTHIYGDLSVDSAITENGQLLSSKYAAASHGTHLTLGTGSGNAYRGDYGNTAYTHSQAAHAPSNAQKNSDITKAEIEAKLTGAITSHTHAYAPTSHASTATTYGVSSASNYGHAMASGTTPKANGTAAVGSETAKFARGDHVHPLQTTVSGNAGTATKLATARTISLGGLLSGSASFDGSANATITAAIAKPPKSGDWWSGGMPVINTDGVMEVGKYIDFHNTDASTNDFDVRLQANTNGPVTITLPSSSGTLARTSDSITGNAATATKLATARTLTIGDRGETFDGSGNVTWTHAEMGVARGNTVSATTAATAQWYRIAQTASDIANNMATFNIQGSVGSYHTSTLLAAGISYGKNPTLIQLAHTNFGAGITKARIVYHTTYSGNKAYLEVYLSQAKATNITVDMQGKHGWTLVAPSTVGSIPSGYTSKEITLTVDKIVGNVQGNVSGSAGSCTGNAATATKFASSQSVALTGDVTGSASSQAGWSVATTLKNSGVTAGNYGPSANASPAHSGTFSVPYITVDAKGRVTAASTKTITLPASGNTDTKVTYTLGTTTKYYMGGPTATATGTGGITFDTGIYATTTAGQLSVGSFQTRGDITTSGNGSHAIGSTSNRFSGIYGANIYSYDKNAKQYASLRLQTEGTADTQGVGRITVGNNTNAGTAGNAKGQILLYGTNTGYTTITPGYNSTSNITVTLPSATGSLPVMSKGDTSYWGICPPDGGTGWIRTTSSGIIPSANGSGALGTSSWQFSSIYGQAIYEGGTALSSKYAAKSHTHSYAASSHTHSYLPLSGGTLTGNVTLQHGTANTEANYVAKRTDTGVGVYMGVGSGGTNHGIYSQKLAKWIAYADDSKIYLQGNADTATKLATARTLTIGATGKSFNGSANVSWSLQEIMKGQGLTAGTASGTLYFNNAGTSHVGRLSCYNNADGDYIQLGLYDTSSSSTVSTLNLYANHARFNKYLVLMDYIRPNSNGSIDMGASSYRWRTVYSANGVSTTSDRTLKENIKYVRAGGTEINYDDMYNFVKDDLELATYNYINSEERHINFIAQDLLVNEDGTDNKVGQFIINPVPVPAKEDIENGEPYPLLSYNTNIYTSVLAGALKESINKIEELESEKAKMQAEINELKADLTELKAIVKGLL